MDQPVDVGRVVAALGDILVDQGHLQAALELLAPVYERVATAPDAEDAILPLTEALARVHSIRGDAASAVPYADRAMELAEAREDWARVVSLLSRQATAWLASGRPTGAIALLRAAVDLARRQHLPRATILPLLNLNAFLKNRDLAEARAAGRDAVEATLQVGALDLLRGSAMNLAITCWVSGDWDEADALYERHKDDVANFPIEGMLFGSVMTIIRTARGEPVGIELTVAEPDAVDETSLYMVALAEALIAEARGDAEGAARHYADVLDHAHRGMGTDDDFAFLLPLAVEAVLAVEDVPEAERLLGYVADAAPGRVTPLARVHLPRLRALVGIARGNDPLEVDADLERATQAFRDFGVPFYLARTLLERAHRVAEHGDDEAAAPLLAEAEELFAGLRANHWLAQVRGVSSVR